MMDFHTYLTTLRTGKQTDVLTTKQIQHITYIVNKFITNYKEITTITINRFLDQYNCRKIYLGHLRHYFRYLYQEKTISKPVFEELMQIKARNKRKIILKEEDKKKFAVPQEKWQEVINQLKNGSQKMACWLGFNFGLRAGEILNLTVNDVDLKNNLLYITPENNPVK